MWRAFLSFILIVPSPVLADAQPDLTVTNTTVLSGVVSLYHTITIKEGGVLILSPGTEVQFRLGGRIEGDGELHSEGTEAQPVLLSGTWQDIHVLGNTTLAWTRIVGAQGPFTFDGHTTEFDHVTVQDAVQSDFLFHPAEHGNVTLNFLTIRWDTVTSQTGDIFVHISGSHEADFLNFRLPQAAALPEKKLVQVDEGYFSLNMIGTQTTDGCALLPEGINLQDMWFTLGSNCHPTQPSLLFIPGYGASVQFDYLLNPVPQAPVLSGWNLIPFITNSYNYFLNQATMRGIKTAIAYYDWRQSLTNIVKNYLIPEIDALKARDHVSQVMLVAHSFGGLVARAYIESSLYRNDIAGLVMLGTPNHGSVKAYGPWEGGVFPDDWQPVSNLVRYYHYRMSSTVHSDIDALHAFIPSGLNLLPTEAVLEHLSGLRQAPLVWSNTTLQQLNNSTGVLQERVPQVFTVAGTGEYTPTGLEVGAQNNRATYWPDGQPAGDLSEDVGDGTVPLTSVLLHATSQLVVSSDHMNIPYAAATDVLARLYPATVVQEGPPLQGASRSTDHILWFAFDCPVNVSITQPDGLLISSTDSAPTVFADPEAIWMLLPEEVGTYHIEITALADTPVRWWQGTDTIHTATLKKGGIKTVTYDVAPSTVSRSSSSPSPSPVIQAVDGGGGPPSPSLRVQAFPFPDITQQAFSPLLVWYVSSVSPKNEVSQTTSSPPVIYGLGLVPLVMLGKKRQSRRRPHHPP